MTQKTHSLRNGIFCALVFLACYVAAWPVANMPFNDDWSYIKTAQVFAETGHVVYNGWAAPILGWMIPWGALFIKVFGFSFMAVKLSTLPLAVGCVLLFHAILRQFEISPRNAVIGTLTLGLSPLFLPLSASFMTDIPGLFVILLCLYCCQRAVAAGTDRAAIGWLVAAALSNIVGGTARQVAWLGVLVMVPCTGWMLRKRRGAWAVTSVLWLAGVGAIFYCMHWFAEQPYSVHFRLLPRLQHSVFWILAYGLLTINRVEAFGLCLLVVIFPLLVVWLRYFGSKLDHYLALLCAGLLPLVAMRFFMGWRAEILPQNLLFAELSMRMVPSWVWPLDLKKTLIPIPVQIVLCLVVLAAAFGCVFVIREKLMHQRADMKGLNGQHIFWLLAPFTLSYFALLLTVIWSGMDFDRYLLGVVPGSIIVAIWLCQRFLGGGLPRISVVLLIFYAAIGVAGTRDWFACQRAQVAAIHELRSAGVPRTEIQGGFEYDGWTQVMDGGTINNPALKSSPGEFREGSEPSTVSRACKYTFRSYFPILHPIYSVGVAPERCYLPSRFPSVHYAAWLPPFWREVVVQRVPNA